MKPINCPHDPSCSSEAHCKAKQFHGLEETLNDWEDAFRLERRANETMLAQRDDQIQILEKRLAECLLTRLELERKYQVDSLKWAQSNKELRDTLNQNRPVLEMAELTQRRLTTLQHAVWDAAWFTVRTPRKRLDDALAESGWPVDEDGNLLSPEERIT